MTNLTLINATLHNVLVHEIDMSSVDFYDIFTTFTNLRAVQMHGCKLTSWPNLTAAHKLELLNINYNKITSLPTAHGLSPSNTVFRELHMGGNSFTISFLPQFLSGLSNLERLGLGNTGATVWPNISGSIHNLQLLIIERNPLYVINSKLLFGVDNFTSQELPPDGYPMVDLNMGDTKISNFPDEMFILFNKLQVLRIRDNPSLTNIPNFTLINSTLRHLEMHGIGKGWSSPYSTFDYTTVFRHMSKMTLLYTYSNNLNKFPFPSAEYIKEHLPILNRLHVAINLIQRIPDLTGLGTSHTNLNVSKTCCMSEIPINKIHVPKSTTISIPSR